MTDPSEKPPLSNSPTACATDAECMTRLQAAADELRAARELPSRTLVEATCEPSECPRDLFCRCVYVTREGHEVSAEALSLGFDERCDLFGRSGDCLVPASEAPVCDPDDGCSCAAQCERALAASASDAERTIDAEARFARCVDDMCQGVLRVEDRCYVGFGVEPDQQTYDCALSDSAILDRAFPASDRPGEPADRPSGARDAGAAQGVVAASSCRVAVGVCNDCYDDAPPLDCSGDGGK